MEEQLQQCDVRGVWKCLKPISGHNNSRPELTRDQEWVNNLNRFFNRFDQTTILRPAHSVQPALSQPQLHPTETSAATSSPSSSSRSILASIRPPCGPSTRPLSCFNHYQPVTLTAHLAKTLERLVLHHLRPLVSSLQFAYQPGIGVEDAVIFLTQRAL